MQVESSAEQLTARPILTLRLRMQSVNPVRKERVPVVLSYVNPIRRLFFGCLRPFSEAFLLASEGRGKPCNPGPGFLFIEKEYDRQLSFGWYLDSVWCHREEKLEFWVALRLITLDVVSTTM